MCKFKSCMIRLFTIATVDLLLFVSPIEAQSAKKILKNDVKFTVLSIGSGSSRFTYERMLNYHTSAEATIGIIGLGFDIMNNADPHGMLFKFAYKWNLLKMKNVDSSLAGLYVKPELVYANYKYKPDNQLNYNQIDNVSNVEYTSQIALLAECGYQFVWNWFVFDIYSGLGPSIGTGNKNNYFHGFMLYPEDGNLAFTVGFRLGIAF